MPRPFSEEEKDRIRATLRTAGREALARGGLRRTPVENLARAAGISKGAFYLFFPTKEALVMDLLLEAEAELRAGLLARAGDGPPEGRVRAVIAYLFASVARHPLLRALADPEELAWLVRALPPGHLEAARADDDRFSAALLARLQAAGAARADVDPVAFTGVGAAALAVLSHRDLIGEDRWEPVVALLVDGLVARIGAPSVQPEPRPAS